MPTPSDVVSRAWASYRAGMLGFDDFQHIQAAMLPACERCPDPLHPRRAVGRNELGQLTCGECEAERLGLELPSGECVLVRGRR